MASRQGFRCASSAESSNGLEMKEKHRKPSPVPVAHQTTWSNFCKYVARKKQPKYVHDRVSDPIRYGHSHMQAVPARTEPQPQPRGWINGPRDEAEIDSDQAAKVYGGLLVTEYYPDPGTKVVRKAYYY
uniref:Uncharacterized protein n=1 Tax=Kalanchoe fedtschenkoi TaxID=63787 RepID=A0A7N0UEL8_KALFE